MTLLSACGGTSTSSHDGVVGTWANVSGDVELYLTINSDNTYEYQETHLVSASVADQRKETGTIVVGDESFAFTPRAWTCSGPYAAYTATYSLSGQTLGVGFDIIVVPYRAAASTPNYGRPVTLGCFASDGSFAPHALGSGGP